MLFPYVYDALGLIVVLPSFSPAYVIWAIPIETAGNGKGNV